MSSQSTLTYQYNLPNIFLIISIGMLLACFTAKAYDLIADLQKISNIDCNKFNNPNTDMNANVNVNSYKILQNDQTQKILEECYNNKTKLTNNYNDTKSIAMLIIGFVYLITGIILLKQIKFIVPVGVGFGGFLLTMFYLIANWFIFSQQSQVAIMGIILLGMIFAGSKFM